MPKKLSHDQYDSRIAIHGKAKRVGEYINSQTPILHRCLEHNEEWLARPGDILNGHGIACCGRVNHDKAKSSYDTRLAAIGMLQRVDEYVSRRKAIRHKCIKHGKIFFMEPRRALEGRNPPCCTGMWRKSLYSMLLNDKLLEIKSHSVVYLYRLSRFNEYVKIGISANLSLRADAEYGDFICYWKTESRFHAFLIEQAVLADTSLEMSCPSELSELHWPGYTEVRKAESESAIKVIQFYHDELESIGIHRFVLSYLDPTDAEKELCQRKLDECGQAV